MVSAKTTSKDSVTTTTKTHSTQVKRFTLRTLAVGMERERGEEKRKREKEEGEEGKGEKGKEKGKRGEYKVSILL